MPTPAENLTKDLTVLSAKLLINKIKKGVEIKKIPQDVQESMGKLLSFFKDDSPNDSDVLTGENFNTFDRLYRFWDEQMNAD